jgi:hypothetical protein
VNTLKSILEEVVGLFIDDGMLALLCVVLIALVTGGILLLGLPSLWGGTLLLVGCIAILAWSVARAAR